MFKIQAAKDTAILEVITDTASYLSYNRFTRKQMMISVQESSWEVLSGKYLCVSDERGRDQRQRI